MSDVIIDTPRWPQPQPYVRMRAAPCYGRMHYSAQCLSQCFCKLFFVFCFFFAGHEYCCSSVAADLLALLVFSSLGFSSLCLEESVLNGSLVLRSDVNSSFPGCHSGRCWACSFTVGSVGGVLLIPKIFRLPHELPTPSWTCLS